MEQLIGYTVVYDRTDGKIGFIYDDKISQGLGFTDSLGVCNLIKRYPGECLGTLKAGKKMTTYYGHEKVKFDTMRIVKVSYLVEDVGKTEKDLLTENAKAKLTEEEYNALVNDIVATCD